jgi:hypothetical protein
LARTFTWKTDFPKQSARWPKFRSRFRFGFLDLVESIPHFDQRQPEKMPHIEVVNPVSISSATSKQMDDYWIVHDFKHDSKTRCYIVTNSEITETSCDNAVILVKQGTMEGRALEPRLVLAPNEFRHDGHLAYTVTTLFSLIVACGAISLLGKD